MKRLLLVLAAVVGFGAGALAGGRADATARLRGGGLESGPAPAGAPCTQVGSGPHHAGLVIAYGGGPAETYCVAFSGDSVSGYELLRQAVGDSNLVVSTGGALGAAVCQIRDVGCPDPGDCFCKFQGASGEYWAYYHLQPSGKWQMSSLGASSYRVHDGITDGWAWGTGSVSTGAVPPVERPCADLGQATPTPPAAATPVAPAPADGRGSAPTRPSSPSPATIATGAPSPSPTNVEPTAGAGTSATGAPAREEEVRAVPTLTGSPGPPADRAGPAAPAPAEAGGGGAGGPLTLGLFAAMALAIAGAGGLAAWRRTRARR